MMPFDERKDNEKESKKRRKSGLAKRDKEERFLVRGEMGGGEKEEGRKNYY